MEMMILCLILASLVPPPLGAQFMGDGYPGFASRHPGLRLLRPFQGLECEFPNASVTSL